MDPDVSKDEACPEEGDEWSRRRLCPDGNCIGVIGPDGRCRECGRAAEGPAPATTNPEAAESAPVPEAPLQPDVPEAPADEADAEDDWSRRRLCPDGGCIGVIGPDGRCKECGRQAEDPPSDA
jgi:hypothetical protein